MKRVALFSALLVSLASANASAQDRAGDETSEPTGTMVSSPIPDALPQHPMPRIVTQWHVRARSHECTMTAYVNRASIDTITITVPFRRPAGMDLLTQPVDRNDDGNLRPLPSPSTISLFDGEQVARGFAQYDSFAPPVIRVRWGFSDTLLDAIRSVAESPPNLYVNLPGLADRPFPLDLNGYHFELLDRCKVVVGERLKAARPPGEGADVTDREPVLNSRASEIGRIRYPSRALREGIEGTVRVNLSVDEYGYPTGCEVAVSSGSTYLDDATCKDLQRFTRYYPALDESGVAAPGIHTRNIRWQMGD